MSTTTTKTAIKPPAPKPNAAPSQKDTLETFQHLKSQILSNAKLTHGASSAGRPRTYDVASSSRLRSQNQFRAVLVAYDEVPKASAPGKVDVEAKVLSRSAVKLSLNSAMEDLLRKGMEELWKD